MDNEAVIKIVDAKLQAADIGTKRIARVDT
jgi:hypothetical protein